MTKTAYQTNTRSIRGDVALLKDIMDHEFKFLVNPALKDLDKAADTERKSALVRLANYTAKMELCDLLTLIVHEDADDDTIVRNARKHIYDTLTSNHNSLSDLQAARRDMMENMAFEFKWMSIRPE